MPFVYMKYAGIVKKLTRNEPHNTTYDIISN